jgi:two-component system response regulator RegA
MQDERTLLVVEDDERFAETLATEFSDRGYAVQTVGSLAEAKCADANSFEYALVDLRLRNDSGLDVIADLKERAPGLRVIVLTGYGSIATAVKATKMGATSYFTKPVDIDEVERAFRAGDEEEEEAIPIPDEFPSLYRHEREYIEYVLAECDGNISQAARRLGLHRQSLQRKLRKFSPS